MPVVVLVFVAGVTTVSVVLVALVALIAWTDRCLTSRGRSPRPVPLSPRTLTAERRRIRLARPKRR